MPGVLYRIVKGEVPALADFRSRMCRCFAPAVAEIEEPRLWSGVSMFNTRDRAEKRARLYHLGSHTAEVHLPDDPRIMVLKTLSRGHYTVMACEDLLHSLVRNVLPVQ